MKRSKNVMVCVTQQKTCERLIMNGHQTMQGDKDKLYVIHVVNRNENFLNNSNDGEALEYLFRVSKEVGADLTVLKSEDIIKAIGDFSKKHEITHIVMGASPNGDNIKNHNFAWKLQNMLPSVSFKIV